MPSMSVLGLVFKIVCLEEKEAEFGAARNTSYLVLGAGVEKNMTDNDHFLLKPNLGSLHVLTLRDS